MTGADGTETGAGLPHLAEDWERALAVVAHPDDLEYGVAGAVARWTAQGKWVGYVLVTSGEAGMERNHADHRAVGSALLDAVRDAANRWLFVGAGGAPWKGVRFVAFGGSPVPTHGVDVTDTLDLAVASLREHAVYLDELEEGTVGKEPDPFLRGLAAAGGEALGVEAATLFEVVPV